MAEESLILETVEFTDNQTMYLVAMFRARVADLELRPAVACDQLVRIM